MMSPLLIVYCQVNPQGTGHPLTMSLVPNLQEQCQGQKDCTICLDLPPLYSDDKIYKTMYLEREKYLVLLVLFDCLVHFDLMVVDSWSYSYLVLALSLVRTFDNDNTYFMECIYLMVYQRPLDHVLLWLPYVLLKDL